MKVPMKRDLDVKEPHRAGPEPRRLCAFWRRLAMLLGLLPLGCFCPQRALGAAPATGAELLELKQAVLTNDAEMVSAGYLDSLASAKNLQGAVNAFLARPSQESLDAARQAWLSAHQTCSPDRIAMKQAITALQTQSDMIARAAKALSIQLKL